MYSLRTIYRSVTSRFSFKSFFSSEESLGQHSNQPGSHERTQTKAGKKREQCPSYEFHDLDISAQDYEKDKEYLQNDGRAKIINQREAAYLQDIHLEIDEDESRRSVDDVQMPGRRSTLFPQLDPPPPPGRLPWWFIYLAWLLVVASTLTGAFFTMLYSLNYGNRRTIKWIAALFISFFQSILILQPIKVNRATV